MGSYDIIYIVRKVIIMNIDITRIKSGIDEYIDIDDNIVFDVEKLKENNIIDIKAAKIKGIITKNNDSYDIDVILSGILVLPCSVTLKPVDINFENNITGNIEELLEEINESSKKTQNTIDIFPIMWENILMEIPIRVVSPEASNVKLEGEGWKLIDNEEKGSLNPGLQKLNDLLK